MQDCLFNQELFLINIRKNSLLCSRYNSQKLEGGQDFDKKIGKI